MENSNQPLVLGGLSKGSKYIVTHPTVNGVSGVHVAVCPRARRVMENEVAAYLTVRLAYNHKFMPSADMPEPAIKPNLDNMLEGVQWRNPSKMKGRVSSYVVARLSLPLVANEDTGKKLRQLNVADNLLARTEEFLNLPIEDEEYREAVTHTIDTFLMEEIKQTFVTGGDVTPEIMELDMAENIKGPTKASHISKAEQAAALLAASFDKPDDEPTLN